MRIVVFECEEWEKDYLRERLQEDLVFIDGPLDEENAPADAEGILVFIYSSVSRAVLDKMPKLRYVGTRSTGVDHIDLDACKERNITVCNVPTYGENTVAEHTFALLLTISRRVFPSVARVRAGSFDGEGLQGFDLKGRTLGVIGTGHIGQHVIRIARGFEMPVLAYDPFPKDGLSDRLGFTYTGLDDLLGNSDIITLHCPYNEHTHHLLNADNLSRIKHGAILLNTARGKLVDSDALFAALTDGRIFAAGLDVLEEESHIKEERQILSPEFRNEVDLHRMLTEHILIHLPNVIVTPHNAFNSKEALQRILDTTIENVQGFSAGNTCNPV